MVLMRHSAFRANTKLNKVSISISEMRRAADSSPLTTVSHAGDELLPRSETRGPRDTIRTMFEESPYWIFRRSIARIIDCIAMKMFWYTSLMNPLLSSSE